MKANNNNNNKIKETIIIPNIYDYNGKPISQILKEGMPSIGERDNEMFRKGSEEMCKFFYELLEKNKMKNKRLKYEKEQQDDDDEEDKGDDDDEIKFEENDIKSHNFDPEFNPNFNYNVFKAILKDIMIKRERNPTKYSKITLNEDVFPMTVSYQRTLMRSPKENERCCKNDQLCAVFTDPKHGWCMRECVFLTNNNNNNNNNRKEEDRMPCVVCMRLAYEYLYLTIINYGESKCSEILKAPFQHLINVDGEYNDYSVIGPTVYSFPVVRINLKQCKTVIKGNIKWLEEDESVYYVNSKQIF